MRSSRSRSEGSTATTFGVVLIVSLYLVGSLAVPVAADGFENRSLSEALRELQQAGLNLVFTSSVVRPEMRVEREPTASDPRAQLDELLEPHGLVAQTGAGGALVVVPASSLDLPFRVDGLVHSRDGTPIADATVRVLELELETSSGADGGFSIELPSGGPYTLEARRLGFIVDQAEGVDPRAARAGVTLILDPAPLMEEELLVTPSRVQIMREQAVGSLDISRDELQALPHLGGDFFRALSLLPGLTANDVTAQFSVRGGRRDETQVLLDGQELYEVYHLQDFDNALSVVAPATLESVDLTTGGFPAEHGDRMSGVLDMTTLTPTSSIQGMVGLSALSAQAGAAGLFAKDRAGWLIQARRGSTDLTSRLLDSEDPVYWDTFAKLDFRISDRFSVRGNLLHADDRLAFSEVFPETSKRIDTDYASSYLWLTHQAVVGSKLLLETAASTSRIDRDRFGLELEEDVEFSITDRRQLDVVSLRQAWTAEAAGKHFLKLGFELRRFDTDFFYSGETVFENPVAQIRERGEVSSVSFIETFREYHYSAHIADRVRLRDELTLEIGARFDRHTQTDEGLISPRLNLAYTVGERSVFRLAWGRFTQSQRPYELQVEDGETNFFPVERSEHRVLGFERVFDRTGKGNGEPLVLRAEIYRREVDNPRPRFENLYEAINTFPEAEPDRVRIAPERSIAEGFELFLRGGFGSRTRWFANYTYSSTDDVLDGRRTPRSFDQTHSLNLDLDLPLGKSWRLNLAWRFHTGWPTTALTINEVIDPETGEPMFEPVLGPLFGQRLNDYHRLDLRASRGWQTRAGALTFYVDIQNAYDRENLAGFDFEFDPEVGVVEGTPESWPGFLPSLGVTLEF